MNEGTMVAYALAANSGASGTYQLGFFSSASFSSWLLGPQAPESCGYYGEIVAGNGQPNYAQNLGGCLTYPTSYPSSLDQFRNLLRLHSPWRSLSALGW